MGATALVVGGVVLRSEATPKTDPLYLKSPGSPDYESSMRPVCAALLSISRTPMSWRRESWIAVPKGSSLHTEIRSAKELFFETDPGSGLATVCVAEELSYEARRDLVSAVLDACRPGLSLGRSQHGPEAQVVLYLANFTGDCEKPTGTPTIVTPSNPPLQTDGASPRR